MPRQIKSAPFSLFIAFFGLMGLQAHAAAVELNPEVKKQAAYAVSERGRKALGDHPVPTIWTLIAQGFPMTADQKRKLFVQDCRNLARLNTDIPAHAKNDATVRIATYNLHDWKDPVSFLPNKKAMMDVIAALQADILVLQEVVLYDNTVMDDFKAMGYAYAAFCAKQIRGKVQIGNLILSKYPFTKKPYRHFYTVDKGNKEKMNFINVSVALPYGRTVSVYGTYLMWGVYPEEQRVQELQELLKAVKADPCPNKVIKGPRIPQGFLSLGMRGSPLCERSNR
jgi:hypothetical protein